MTDIVESTINRKRLVTGPLVSVYDGQQCLGHVLGRGKAGYEAFDRDDKSVGFFETQRQGANALLVAGGGI